MNVLDTKIEGLSIGGCGTSIVVPQFQVAFDMGLCTDTAVTHAATVCVTHGHMDHIGSLCRHVSRRELLKLPPPTYLVSPEIADTVSAIMDLYRKLNDTDLPCHIVPFQPGDRFNVRGGYIEAFQTDHRIPSQGYVLFQTKRCLRPDLVGLTKEEIRALAMKGEEVSHTVTFPKIAFTGDTRINVLEHEVVRKAEILITECTFFGQDKDPEWAGSTGHIHLDQLVSNQERLENKVVLLVHFSARYSYPMVREAVESLGLEKFMVLEPSPTASF